MLDPAGNQPTRGWRDWTASAWAVGATLFLGMILSRHWHLGPVDDAYISLRYAANWASGRGLCFNPGERVEGYTNYLLVFLQMCGMRLGLGADTVLRAIGWFSVVALAAVVTRFSTFGLFGGRRLFGATAGVLVALNPALFCWALSGLETPLYALLVLGSVLLVDGSRPRRHAVAAGICLTLAGMTRPEAIVLFPFLAGLLYLNTRSREPVVRFALVFILGFGSYFIARAVWYGSLFPNTFYAKLDYGNSLLVRRGLVYIWSFAKAAPLLILLALASIPIIRRAPRAIVGCAAIAGVQILTTIYEGGDHFALFRFMVPGLPLLGLTALYTGEALSIWRGWSGWRRDAVSASGLLVLALSSLTIADARFKDQRESQLQMFRLEASYPPIWGEVGQHLRKMAPRDASLCTGPIGAIGYLSELRIIDPLGLVNPIVAHKKVRLGLGYPGHEKYDADAVLSRQPSYLLILTSPESRPVPKAFVKRLLWGRYNAELLEDPRVEEDYRYETFLTYSGYWGIFVRKDMPPVGTPESEVGRPQ